MSVTGTGIERGRGIVIPITEITRKGAKERIGIGMDLITVTITEIIGKGVREVSVVRMDLMTKAVITDETTMIGIGILIETEVGVSDIDLDLIDQGLVPVQVQRANVSAVLIWHHLLLL